MIFAVILAGGLGSRAGKIVPKQHAVVNGHQLIEYTIESFSNCSLIDGIVIVSNKDYLKEMSLIVLDNKKVMNVIVGGKTRIGSVQAAVKELAKYASGNDKVIFSDAARPFVTKKELCGLISELDRCVAATTYQKLNETLLKQTEKGISGVILREGCLRQTSPEAYLFSTLKKLYLDCSDEAISDYKNIGIDQLVFSGVEIGLVESSPFNYKITDEEDFAVFEALLSYGFKRIINGDYKE